MAETQITIRLQSREGLKRIQIPASEITRSLYAKTLDTFGYVCFAFTLHKDKNDLEGSRIKCWASETIQQAGIRDGDIIFVEAVEGCNLFPEPEDEEIQDATAGSSSTTKIVEDEVDELLFKQDGRIQQLKDLKMCAHGENEQCVSCTPLEHLSFHSYIKKLNAGDDKGESVAVALEDLSVSVAGGCTEHPPWPQGICSKCQPPAVTISRQAYRHVDNVMFENPHIIERFLAYWRSTGFQRMGFLFGRYEEHADVPLGIRAKVAAIYEPPQALDATKINFNLPDDEKFETAKELAASVGLKCVGWIFTDLIPESVSKGTFKHLRGSHSYFMSAQECVTAANFQDAFPNPCHLSQKTGYFGSKFVTVVVTGDETNQVQMVGFQVSNQCMGLVRDGCLLPAEDSPGQVNVKESSEKQYVPDIFYKQKDESGNEVTILANGKPLPVEYLLVDVPVSIPEESRCTFAVPAGVTPFPVENRLVEGQIQDVSALAAYLNPLLDPTSTPFAFMEFLNDFHFLLYIATTHYESIQDALAPLYLAARKEDFKPTSHEWQDSIVWKALEKILKASMIESMIRNPSAPAANLEGGPVWICPNCTVTNQIASPNCWMCELPNERD